ncbi:unnamed protein product [Diamesa serratosioi]
MKLFFVAVFGVLAVVAQAKKEIEINWSKVEPFSKDTEVLIKSVMPPPIDTSDKSDNADIPFVMGGHEADEHDFPYQVGLVITEAGSDNNPFCGGVLISNNRVLTAAHCLMNATSVIVILGAHMIDEKESTQVKFEVPKSGLVVHPDYDNEKVLNDVAMIKLPSEVTFNDEIKPIALPIDGDNDFAGEKAVLTGWGIFDSTEQKSTVLNAVDLNVITNKLCHYFFPHIIKDGSICTSGTDHVGGCSGDSGGPLAVQSNGQSLLIGIASFVYSDTSCDNGYPSGFSRVSYFIPWIKSNM